VFAAISPLLAEFKWDPQVRGIVIVITAVSILIGSVYLLLATNVGARVGFLLTVAGLSGWLILLGILWMLNAQGLKGREPSWKVVEIATGPPGATIANGTEGLPPTPDGTPTGKWSSLPKGDPVLGDATAAAEKLLATDNSPVPEGKTRAEPKFKAPYNAPADYLVLTAFEQGGKQRNVWFAIKHHRFYRNGPAWNPAGWFRSPPHYVAITVQKVAPKLDPTNVLEASRPDMSQSPTTIVLVRDRGSIRFPPFMVILANSIIFAVTCVSLHRRDKALAAAKVAGRARPATA
jgi:hypothetical protein